MTWPASIGTRRKRPRTGRTPNYFSALCVQLCFEVMEDAATSVGAGAEWKPRTESWPNCCSIETGALAEHVRRTQHEDEHGRDDPREREARVKASIARDKSAFTKCLYVRAVFGSLFMWAMRRGPARTHKGY